MTENLSEHFTVSEFEYSDTAVANKISNKMNEGQRKEVEHFCVYCLEPIRKLFKEKYGKVSVKITSGFRGDKLNAKVRGARTSQHCANPGKGAAADIWVYKYDKDNKKVQIPVEDTFNDILEWTKKGKCSVDQAIYEVALKAGKVTTKWLHLSCAGQLANNRKAFLSYKDGKYKLIADL